MRRLSAFRRAILLTLPWIFPGALVAQPKIVAVVNSASWQSGLPAGGALATAFVSGLPGLTPGTYAAPPSQPLPYTLVGVTVIVNNDYAPLLAVIVPSDPSANVQVNFQVPLSANASQLSGNFFVPYDIRQDGYAGYISIGEGIDRAAQSPVPAMPDWGGFFSDARGYAIAIHASDSSPVTPQNPARPGEPIVAYADGLFLVWPPPPIAVPVPLGGIYPIGYTSVAHGPGNLYLQTYPTAITACVQRPCPGSVTNTPALTVQYLGLAPGLVGVEQVDFVVPSNQKPGTWALFFNIGSCPDGSGIPGTCGAVTGSSSPYVLLPVD